MAEKMNCGLGILIVNHFKDNPELMRPGAENEKNRMMELYEALGLDIELHEELTLKQMKEVLEEASKSPNLKNHEILVIGISSHGGDSGLFGIDAQKDNPGEKALSDEFIYRQFRGDKKSPMLKDKPKLIIRNGGRGKTNKLEIPKIKADEIPHGTHLEENEKIGADFLTICSTVDEYAAFKQIEKGSNLAPFLKDAIEKNPNKHLPSFLKDVNEKLSSVGYFDEDENMMVQELLSVTIGMKRSLILNNGKMKHVSYT